MEWTWISHARFNQSPISHYSRIGIIAEDGHLQLGQHQIKLHLTVYVACRCYTGPEVLDIQAIFESKINCSGSSLSEYIIPMALTKLIMVTIKAEPLMDSPSSINNIPTMPRAAKVGHKKSRLGCQRCKQRRVKVGPLEPCYEFLLIRLVWWDKTNMRKL